MCSGVKVEEALSVDGVEEKARADEEEDDDEDEEAEEVEEQE